MVGEINQSNSSFRSGELLIAMPQMEDPRFARTVIYVCAHTEEGAMGLVLNKYAENITFSDLMDQLNLPVIPDSENFPVHFGGPVQASRGFVLHTADFTEEGSLFIANNIALTATVDILRKIADGRGPEQSLLALGYAGWAPGQLDSEIQANGWLSAPADPQIIFDNAIEIKWTNALHNLGIDVSMLSSKSGNA